MTFCLGKVAIVINISDLAEIKIYFILSLNKFLKKDQFSQLFWHLLRNLHQAIVDLGDLHIWHYYNHHDDHPPFPKKWTFWNHFTPMVHFYTPWKRQKNPWFSVVFRGYRNKSLAWNKIRNKFSLNTFGLFKNTQLPIWLSKKPVSPLTGVTINSDLCLHLMNRYMANVRQEVTDKFYLLWIFLPFSVNNIFVSILPNWQINGNHKHVFTR